jgi:hypothetical protein
VTQIIVVEHIDPETVLEPIQAWTTGQRITDLRPYEVIKDERIPQLLHTLKQPTFVTIDSGFWNRDFLHPAYCIIYFALEDSQQYRIPQLLRRLFRLDVFRTRVTRMGKVARVRSDYVDYWQWGDEERHTLPMPRSRQRRSR